MEHGAGLARALPGPARVLTLLRSLYPYFRRYRRAIAAGLVCVVLGNLFQLSGPQFLRRGIDAIGAGRPLNSVTWLALGLIAAAILTGAARYGMRQLLNGVSRRIETDIRDDLYRHLETLEPAFFHRNPTGDLMALATNDLGAVRMVAGPAIMYLVETITRLAMAIPLMGNINWRLTALGLIPMCGVPAAIVALGPAIERRFRAVQEHFATLTTFAHENLSGVRIVRAYRQEGPQTERFRALSEEYQRRNIRLARAWGALFPLVGLIGEIGGVVTLWYGSALVIRGVVTVGDFVAYLTYLTLLIWPMIALGWVINLFQRGTASMARIQVVLDEQAKIRDPEAPSHLPVGRKAPALEFDHVWFRYPTAKGAGDRGWTLQDITFTAASGQWVAIVGATGSGKSTLVELIARLADADQGTIRLAGVPIRELPLAELRRAVGFVPQDTFLFSQTIAENIGLGELPQSDVEWATDVAQLKDTITALPQRYDTMLGERGINLSGGQKQRAAIARALARKPGLVVLDDALSAVDTETEAAILRNLRGALEGRTALVVSHRITAVREADLIVVLDEGKVVETGQHEELFERRGRYWELLRRQQMEESLQQV
ncbi:MAG: ABC transporter ATP-binding protein [Gemmatimonadales bacterium]